MLRNTVCSTVFSSPIRSPHWYLALGAIALALIAAPAVCHGQQSGAAGPIENFRRRQTADDLLGRAREALNNNNVELAEFYVSSAERLDVEFSSLFSHFSDTPQRVRQAIQAKRHALQQSGIPIGAVADTGAPPAMPVTLSGLDNDPRPVNNKANAAVLLQKARAAIADGNLVAAVGWYKSAAALGVAFAEGEDSPARVYNELLQRGIAAEQLQLHPSIPARLPPDFGKAAVAVNLAPNNSSISVPEELRDPQSVAVNGGDAISSSSLLERAARIKSDETATAQTTLTSERQRVMQLIAQAQAALDRNDVALAEQFAVRAQELRLPEAAYLAGDTRPWMVLMEISKAQRRRGTTDANLIAENQMFAAPQAPSGVGPSYAIPPNGNAVINYEMQTGQVALTQATEPFPPATMAPPTAPPAHVPGSVVTAQSLAPPPAATPDTFPANSNATGPEMITSPFESEIDTPSTSVIEAPNAEEQESAATDDRAIGSQIYREGVDALGNAQLEEAEALFREAWKYESKLDASTRQSLQDHLHFVRQQLRRKRPASPAPLNLDRPAESLVLDSTESQGNDPVDAPQEIAREINQDQASARQAATEKLLTEITRKQVAVQTMRQSDPKKAWDELNGLRDQIARADIDEEPRGQLLRRMERQITDLENYIEKNRGRIESDERNKRILDDIDRRRALKSRNEQKLAELVEQFNELMDSRRFPEAVVIAKKARELDPQNAVVQNMIFKSQTARQIHSELTRDDAFQRGALATFDSVENAAVAPDDEWNMQFPRYWEDLTKRRKNLLADKQRRYTDVELQIQKSLQKEVDVHFENVSLAEVMDQLARMANVNVYVDPEGLAAEGVTSDTPVAIDLRGPVMLKSALNLILEPLHLSYVIQDEVLRITSEQVRDGDVYTDTYNVADLVIPIPNFVPSYNIGLPGAIREAHRVLGSGYGGMGLNQQPMMMADNQAMGTGSTSASVLAQMGSTGMLGSNMGTGPGFGPAGAGGGSQADFDTLIELITATIEPDSWEEVGGPGAIDGFPGNLSLVVSQTQDVHERIIDLLEQLRRLQDLQVTIEVRFITLNDDFFERIGVDFDFNIDSGSPFGTLSEVEQAQRDGITPNVVIGLDPTGTPTVDLDIPFTQGSFDSTAPVFGGFTPDAAANIGFAILSDIEAFFLIQASQGDTRSNVLQAPKVTLFNGQTAFVSNTAQRPFVTSVIPVVGDFAAAHQPVITVLTEGTSLSVQAVVSQDRRFIRLTLVPFFSQIGDVDTFTFNGSTTSDTGTTTVDPSDGENNVTNNQQTTTQGTTVQLPTFAFTTVNTTVSVPDGGTILLGGIKSLSEGRNERGVPMLSKLPYVNRLFKNVGLGREASSLMMMVTPRIIIQEEQEENLGFNTSP